MLQSIRISIVMLVAFTVILCVAYPAFITGVSNVVMPDKAQGSIITQDGKVIGSELIGQSFSDPKYFWGRPSATGPVPYNAAASSGSNLGAASDNLKKSVQSRLDDLKKDDAAHSQKVPVDLVTSSGSGLDPEISPASAEYQISRVAKARNVPDTIIRELVQKNTKGRQFGFLGEPRVNVLLLNKALDEMLSK